MALIASPYLCTHRVIYVAPTLGAVSLVSLFPLVVVFLFALCATGYMREVIKGQLLTSCVGTSCSAFVSRGQRAEVKQQKDFQLVEV